MASNKPVIHGRDHRPGGSDPVFDTDGIRFDFDNVGDWLDVHTTGADGSSHGIRLRNTGTSDLLLESGGSSLSMDNGGNVTLLAVANIGIDNTGTTWLDAGAFSLAAATGVSLEANSGGNHAQLDLTHDGSGGTVVGQAYQVQFATAGGTFSVNSASPGQQLVIDPDGTFNVYGYDGVSTNLNLRVDPDGTIHGRASVGTMTWDL